MYDLMLDLETLGTKPGAVVLSVGAVQFNRLSGKIIDKFYAEINPVSSQECGLHLDADTIQWWMSQSEEARKIFTSTERMVLPSVVRSFEFWYRQLSEPVKYIWAQGQDFDAPIWARAIIAGGRTPPWEYNQLRDTRTAYLMAYELTGFNHRNIKREGVHHNALDDCYHQIKCLTAAHNNAQKNLGFLTPAEAEEDPFG